MFQEMGHVAEEAFDGAAVESGGLPGAVETEGIGAVNRQC